MAGECSMTLGSLIRQKVVPGAGGRGPSSLIDTWEETVLRD